MTDKLTKESVKEAGGTLEGTKEWADASKQLQDEKKDLAASVEEFSDYIELKNIKFYKPTTRHKWALAAFAQEDNNMFNVMAGGYILAIPAKDLSRIYTESKSHKDGHCVFDDNCLEFAEQFEILELATTVTKLCKSDEPEQESKNS